MKFAHLGFFLHIFTPVLNFANLNLWLKNILWYKEINYWRIEFSMLYWWQGPQSSMDHPLTKGFLSRTTIHHVTDAPWFRLCSQALWGDDLLCVSTYCLLASVSSQEELLVNCGTPVQSVCIRTWLLGVGAQSPVPRAECGRVRMGLEQAVRDAKPDWLDFLSSFIHQLCHGFPADIDCVSPWVVVMATSDPHACRGRGPGQSWPLLSPWAAGKPFAFWSWHLACSIAHEKLTAWLNGTWKWGFLVTNLSEPSHPARGFLGCNSPSAWHEDFSDLSLDRQCHYTTVTSTCCPWPERKMRCAWKPPGGVRTGAPFLRGDPGCFPPSWSVALCSG